MRLKEEVGTAHALSTLTTLCYSLDLTYDFVLLNQHNTAVVTTYVFLLYLHNGCFTYALRLPQLGGTTEQCTQTKKDFGKFVSS